jgi:O-antigen/teichoic acid export membrane protein
MDILKNTLWSTLSNGFAFFLMTVSQIIIGRKLGASILGEYYLIITINLIATTILSLGIGLSNTVFTAKKEYPLSEINIVSIFYSFCLGGCGILFLWLSNLLRINIFGSINRSYLIYPFLMLPFTLYMLYWNSLMVGTGKIVLQSKLIIYLSTIWCVLNILSVFLGIGMIGLIYSWIFYVSISFFSMLFIAFKQDTSSIRLNLKLLRSVLNFGFRGNIGEVATQIWKRMNIFLLSYFHGVNAVGIYSVAAELNEKILLITGPIKNALTNRITSSSKEDGRVLMAKASRNIFFWFFVLILFLIMSADLVISILYGKQFNSAINPFRILLVGTLATGVTPIVSIFFIGQLRMPGLLSLLATFNALISIVVGMLLIPGFNVIGTAIGYTTASIIGIVLLIYFLNRFSKCSIREIFIIKKSDFMEYKKFFRFKNSR